MPYKTVSLGFDHAFLVEDFLCKIDTMAKKHQNIEVILYSGTSGEILQMLRERKIDYAILSEKDEDLIPEAEKSHDIFLKPNILWMDGCDTYIESCSKEATAVKVYWIPKYIIEDKLFFSEIIRKLSRE